VDHSAVAGGAAEQSAQESTVLVTRAGAVAVAVLLQQFLHAVKQGSVDDRLLLAFVDLVLVADLAELRDVG
jgi:hypothetical protein